MFLISAAIPSLSSGLVDFFLKKLAIALDFEDLVVSLQSETNMTMNHDVFQSVPQGSDGAQEAENSRIAAIANELQRLCAVHETQSGTGQADVTPLEADIQLVTHQVTHQAVGF